MARKLRPQAARRRRGRMLAGAERLYARAVADRRTAGSCVAAMSAQHHASVAIGGWSFLLTLDRHGEVDCVHFSAQLQPIGRSSTARDWENLGLFHSQIERLTGLSADQRTDPLTPFATTHPSRVLHWHWHSDGSDVDPVALEAMRAALQEN